MKWKGFEIEVQSWVEDNQEEKFWFSFRDYSELLMVIKNPKQVANELEWLRNIEHCIMKYLQTFESLPLIGLSISEGYLDPVKITDIIFYPDSIKLIIESDI